MHKSKVLFTNELTLEELKEGTNEKAKTISAKVLKEYIDYRLSSNNSSTPVQNPDD